MENYCPECRKVFPVTYLICPYCGTHLKSRVGRQPIPRQLRHQVFQRDNYRCRECGARLEDGATLEIDHIIPVAKGGTNDINNLQTLCKECNRAKFTDNWVGGHTNYNREKYVDEIQGQVTGEMKSLIFYLNRQTNDDLLLHRITQKIINGSITTKKEVQKAIQNPNQLEKEMPPKNQRRLQSLKYELENLKDQQYKLNNLETYYFTEDKLIDHKFKLKMNSEKIIELEILIKEEEIKIENKRKEKARKNKEKARRKKERKAKELLYKKLYIEDDDFLDYLFFKYNIPFNITHKQDKIKYLITKLPADFDINYEKIIYEKIIYENSTELGKGSEIINQRVNEIEKRIEKIDLEWKRIINKKQKAVYSTSKTKICPNCGGKLNSVAINCGHCGYNLR